MALLDTHTLYWLVTAADQLTPEGLFAIGEHQAAGTLYASPITAWELALASRKPPHKDPPDLGKLTPARWYQPAISAVGAKVIAINHKIACEAAEVIDHTGHKDPGDCYLIATARVRKIPIITRDEVIRGFAATDYVQVILC